MHFGKEEQSRGNVCSSGERSEMRLFMDVGSCFIILGGWFECLKSLLHVSLPLL